MPKPDIGLAMIMQTERTHIPATLAQFYHVVDDIVVVDGGSEDDSIDWAERMGARVVKRPFDNDFAAQKNFAIENLETDWVYLHDPDERLEPTLLEILPMLTTIEGQSFLMKADIIPPSEEFFDCFGGVFLVLAVLALAGCAAGGGVFFVLEATCFAGFIPFLARFFGTSDWASARRTISERISCCMAVASCREISRVF